ncbi:hypothetical protein BHM03_00000766 [Ensete ventricosum]|nr:hypothetical protein BHM03_00000766 [Ensete ventricosum]
MGRRGVALFPRGGTRLRLVLYSPLSLLSRLVFPCGEKEACRRRIAHGRQIARGTGVEQTCLFRFFSRQKYDYEKEKRHKHRSRSRSKDRFSKRTKSRSPSPSKRHLHFSIFNFTLAPSVLLEHLTKRTSGFDMAPLGVPDAAIAGIGSFALMPAQAVTQQDLKVLSFQATRHARRVYVGGLPPMANEQVLFYLHFILNDCYIFQPCNVCHRRKCCRSSFSMKKLVLQSGSASHFPVVALGANTSAELPTKVVCLTEVAVAALASLGSLLNLVIPRPSPTGEAISGVGKVFLEYGNVADSARAKIALHGRRFGGNVVSATYYSEEKFSTGDYGPMVMA